MQEIIKVSELISLLTFWRSEAIPFAGSSKERLTHAEEYFKKIEAQLEEITKGIVTKI